MHRTKKKTKTALCVLPVGLQKFHAYPPLDREAIRSISDSMRKTRICKRGLHFMNSQYTISVKNLEKKYPEFCLSGITFTVEPGQIVG